MTGQSIFILGLNFLQNYYTIFDQENLKVGLTLAKTANKRVVKMVARDIARAKNLI